jgi:predicted XRE-type DNA-binding protein
VKDAKLHDEFRRQLARALLAWLRDQELLPVTRGGRYPYQQKAAKVLGWNQQTVSRLQRGKLDSLSMERLLRAWTRIGGNATLRLKSPAMGLV